MQRERERLLLKRTLWKNIYMIDEERVRNKNHYY